MYVNYMKTRKDLLTLFNGNEMEDISEIIIKLTPEQLRDLPEARPMVSVVYEGHLLTTDVTHLIGQALGRLADISRNVKHE